MLGNTYILITERRVYKHLFLFGEVCSLFQIIFLLLSILFYVRTTFWVIP